MSKNIINSIVITNSQICHILLDKKSKYPILKGISIFDIVLTNNTLIENAISEIASNIKKNKLTNLVMINNKILKYVFMFQDNETSGNIRIELLNRFKTNFDISMADYYIDFEVYEKNKKKIAFVAGIPKNLLDNLVIHFQRAKFKLLSLETELNSLKRLNSIYFKNSIIMNINMKEEETIFIVTENNILYLFRELNFGFSDIIKFLSESLNMEPNDILEKIRQKDFTYENYPLSEAIDRLTIEIQRTMDFYNNQYRDDPIVKFILTGKLLFINSIEKFLSETFAIKVEKFNPLKDIYIQTDFDDFDSINCINELIGAGLRENG